MIMHIFNAHSSSYIYIFFLVAIILSSCFFIRNARDDSYHKQLQHCLAVMFDDPDGHVEREHIPYRHALADRSITHIRDS